MPSLPWLLGPYWWRLQDSRWSLSFVLGIDPTTGACLVYALASYNEE